MRSRWFCGLKVRFMTAQPNILAKVSPKKLLGSTGDLIPWDRQLSQIHLRIKDLRQTLDYPGRCPRLSWSAPLRALDPRLGPVYYLPRPQAHEPVHGLVIYDKTCGLGCKNDPFRAENSMPFDVGDCIRLNRCQNTRIGHEPSLVRDDEGRPSIKE